MKKESVAEFLGRGGKITRIANVQDRQKTWPKNYEVLKLDYQKGLFGRYLSRKERAKRSDQVSNS